MKTFHCVSMMLKSVIDSSVGIIFINPWRKTPYLCTILDVLEVIRKFFLKHNKSFRWHLGDYEKHNFFPFEGL